MDYHLPITRGTVQYQPSSFPLQEFQSQNYVNSAPTSLQDFHHRCYPPTPKSISPASPPSDSSAWYEQCTHLNYGDGQHYSQSAHIPQHASYGDTVEHASQQASQINHLNAVQHPYSCSPLETPAARPRAFSLRTSTLLDDEPRNTSEVHPPSSYLVDPQKHEPYMAEMQLPYRQSMQSEDTEAKHYTRSLYAQQDQRPISPSREPLRSSARFYRNLKPMTAEERSRKSSQKSSSADSSEDLNNQPYAKLIFKALMSAPGHRMFLKQIYEWFEKNTDKARGKNGSEKGWQNSIRHNLSMNGAFRKVEQTPLADGSKKGFVWVLEESAEKEGVKSTTRYRKTGLHKKAPSTEHKFVSSQQRSRRRGPQNSKRSRARRTRQCMKALSSPEDLRENGSFYGVGVRRSSAALAAIDFMPTSLSHFTPYFTSQANQIDSMHQTSATQYPFSYEEPSGASTALLMDPLKFRGMTDQNADGLSSALDIGSIEDESFFESQHLQ